ncbi:hypothetical protein TCAL_11855 [Tigriopus californicus]|uniref:CUB domain-containing protein n=1 Tax=Tigriopus californicus TaxID=6832 RepID=A0A553PGK8_TIGCA|nr:uncharacterized protein LOC131880026 [Tigriopus californicus]TRY76809.1 hypothetical protein TCAL_11855 [Tigriopus californicus]
MNSILLVAFLLSLANARIVLEMDASTASPSMGELRAQLDVHSFDEEELDETCDVPVLDCGPSSGSNRAENLNVALSPYCEHELKSPGFQERINYPAGQYSCLWSFQSNHPLGVIRLRVEPANFKLAGDRSADCSNSDSLTITGIEGEAASETTLCGALDEPLDFETKGRSVSLRFNKISKDTAPGFKVKIIADKNLF